MIWKQLNYAISLTQNYNFPCPPLGWPVSKWPYRKVLCQSYTAEGGQGGKGENGRVLNYESKKVLFILWQHAYCEITNGSRCVQSISVYHNNKNLIHGTTPPFERLVTSQ